MVVDNYRQIMSPEHSRALDIWNQSSYSSIHKTFVKHWFGDWRWTWNPTANHGTIGNCWELGKEKQLTSSLSSFEQHKFVLVLFVCLFILNERCLLSREDGRVWEELGKERWYNQNTLWKTLKGLWGNKNLNWYYFLYF